MKRSVETPRRHSLPHVPQFSLGEDIDLIVGLTSLALTGNELLESSQSHDPDHKTSHLLKAGLTAAVAAGAFQMMGREHRENQHSGHTGRDHKHASAQAHHSHQGHGDVEFDEHGERQHAYGRHHHGAHAHTRHSYQNDEELEVEDRHRHGHEQHHHNHHNHHHHHRRADGDHHRHRPYSPSHSHASVAFPVDQINTGHHPDSDQKATFTHNGNDFSQRLSDSIKSSVSTAQRPSSMTNLSRHGSPSGSQVHHVHFAPNDD